MKQKKERPLWIPYYPRKTKTKKEKEESTDKKHKKNWKDEIQP